VDLPRGETRVAHSESRSDTSGSWQHRRDARERSSWGFSGSYPLKVAKIPRNVRLLCLSFFFVLFLFFLDQDSTLVRYYRTPFEKEPDFKATSVNYDVIQLQDQAREPA
jgi:hypothetical protein